MLDLGREAPARFGAIDGGSGGPRQERKRARDEHPEPFGGAPRPMRQWGQHHQVDAPPSPPPEPPRRLPQNGGPPRGDFYRPMEEEQQRNGNGRAHNGPPARDRFNGQDEDVRMRDDHAPRRGRDWNDERGRPHVKEHSPPRPVLPLSQAPFRAQRDPVSFGPGPRDHDMPRGHTHSPQVTRPPLGSHHNSSYNGQREGPPPPPGLETRARGRSFSGVADDPSPRLRGLPQQEDMFRARVERETGVIEPGPSARARVHSFNDGPRAGEFGARQSLTVDTGNFARNHVSPSQRMEPLPPQSGRSMHSYSRSPEQRRGQQLPSAGPRPRPGGGQRSAHNSPTAGTLNMSERFAPGRMPNNVSFVGECL